MSSILNSTMSNFPNFTDIVLNSDAGLAVAGFVVGGAVLFAANKAYNHFTAQVDQAAAAAPVVKTDVEKALDLYNNGGVRNNLKSRVAFAKIAFFATGRAIANIVKTVFFALTGINKNRRDSMRMNARAAVVEIKLATLANLGVIAPSLAQRVQNRA